MSSEPEKHVESNGASPDSSVLGQIHNKIVDFFSDTTRNNVYFGNLLDEVRRTANTPLSKDGSRRPLILDEIREGVDSAVCQGLGDRIEKIKQRSMENYMRYGTTPENNSDAMRDNLTALAINRFLTDRSSLIDVNTMNSNDQDSDNEQKHGTDINAPLCEILNFGRAADLIANFTNLFNGYEHYKDTGEYPDGISDISDFTARIFWMLNNGISYGGITIFSEDLREIAIGIYKHQIIKDATNIFNAISSSSLYPSTPTA